MRIEAWSDVVCPWCYIGKRRLESALAALPEIDDVEIVWRSFQLDPAAPPEREEPTTEYLARKYGVSAEQARAMNQRVTDLAEEEGLGYDLEGARHGNTMDAHRLLHLAARHGLQAELKERLLRGYFTEREPVGDHDALTRLSVEVGLPEDEVRGVLDSERFTDEVRADQRQAYEHGASGVPFFVVDGKFAIPGAQPVETFTRVLERAWSERRPTIMTAADGGSAASGGDCSEGACAG